MAGTVSYFNLTGGLNTIQGLGTINQSNKRTESPDMKNVEYYKLGGLISMNGNTQFANTLDAPISLGYEYIYGNNKYMVVITTNSEVFIYDKVSGNFKLIFKFENKNKRHSICSFNNGIVMSNGIDDLVFYQYGRHELIASVVTTTENSSTVTGSNTKFTESLSVGDYVIFGTDTDTLDNKYMVTEITDDTTLVLDRPYPSTNLETSMYLSDLSACNAKFKTQGESPVETNVRGLALNSYNGRIFVGGTDGILYYSEVGLIHGWSQEFGAGAIPSFYDDNSDFTALGLFDKYLIIFKRERCYLLDGNDVDDTNWTVTPYSLYTCDSQQSWIDADSSLLVYSRNAGGIYPVLKRTIYNPIFQGSELSMKIRDSFQFINEARFDYIFPVYHPEKKYVMFYVPLLTGKGSNTAFIYDVTSKTWLKREVPQNVTIAFRFDNEVYIGTDEGKILKEFSGLTFDGSPIEFYWKSPSFTFGQGTNFLSAREFRVKMSEEYTNNFRIRNSRDGKTTYTERKINSNENAFTGLVWDVGYNEDDLNPEFSNTFTSYQVVDLEGENYWVKDNSLVDTTKLYSDEACTNQVGIIGSQQLLLQTNDKNAATYVDKEVSVGYKYTYSYRQYNRYTNGTDYVWIPYDVQTVGNGTTCLVSKEASTTLKMYGYKISLKGQTTTLYLNPNDSHFRNSYYLPRDASGVQYQTWNGYTLLLKGDTPATVTQILAINTGAILTWNISSPNANLYETTGTSTGSNIAQASTSNIISMSETSTGVYTITTGSGTFTNMSNPVPDGGTFTGNCYANTNDITPQITIYADEQLSTVLGTANSSTTFTINSFNKNVNISEQSSSYHKYTYTYYTKIPNVYTLTGETGEGTNGYAIILPTEADYNTETITDTVWDEDSWVVSSYITKRFPLMNQIFQTMSVEFYGNGLNDGMCIYGFEIDGVQLEEVPW